MDSNCCEECIDCSIIRLLGHCHKKLPKLSPIDLVNNDSIYSTICMYAMTFFLSFLMLTEIIVLVSSTIVILMNFNNTSCICAIFACLVFGTIVQVIRVFTRERAFEIFSFVLSCVFYYFAIDFYFDRANPCGGSNIIYLLIIANVVLTSIWYVIIAILVLIIVSHLIFNYKMPWDLENDYSDYIITLSHSHISLLSWLCCSFGLFAKRRTRFMVDGDDY